MAKKAAAPMPRVHELRKKEKERKMKEREVKREPKR